jgi:hypothetical protein
MQAPLGLAVIGGLVMSTFATLLVLPSIFAVVIGRSVARSPSIYPDDPDSAHYDPLAYDPIDEKVIPSEVERVPSHPQQADGHIRASDGGRESGNAANMPPELPPYSGDY